MNKKMQRHWLFVLRPFYLKRLFIQESLHPLGPYLPQISASLSLLEENPISDSGKRKTVCHWRREGEFCQASHTKQTPAKKKEKVFSYSARPHLFPMRPFDKRFFLKKNISPGLMIPALCQAISATVSPSRAVWSTPREDTPHTWKWHKMLNKTKIKCKMSELVKLLK